MKKIIVALLAVVVLVASCLSLVACTNDTQVKVIDIKLTDEQYAYIVGKNDTAFLAQVNEFLAEIKADGTFQTIVDKYFGAGTDTPTAVISATENSTKDQLIVATNAAFAPFEYMEGNNYFGIDMEIAAALAKKLGKELVIKNIEFDSVIPEVENGYANIGMAGLTVNSEREKVVTFSDPYYNASQKLIVPLSDTTFDDCKTAADVEAILNTKKHRVKVGVQKGTTGQFYVEGDEEWGFDGYKVTCVAYTNGALAVQDLLNGGLKYVVIDEAPANAIANAINAVNKVNG